MRAAAHLRFRAIQTLCCVALATSLMLPSAEAQAANPKVAQRSKTAHAPTRKLAIPKRNSSPPTRIQPATLRYTGLSSLPLPARSDLPPWDGAAAGSTDAPETRCANGLSSKASADANNVSPCLGLYHGPKDASSVKFRFDVALKSIGAPKDIFVGPCPAGNHSQSCNSFIGDAKAEQERLADALNQQRRHPVATLGVAVSF